MKKLTIATLTALFTISAFAQTIGKVEKAAKQEKLILCKSVERQLEILHADASVDITKCTKGKIIRRLITEGIVEVRGQVPFNSPERSFVLSCSVAYDASNKDELIADPTCE